MQTNSIFEFSTNNGSIIGRKINVESSRKIVILAAGHNGFYHYGMFPTIQETLANKGISSIAFNYTHCGISNDGSTFEDLEKYQKNCRRLEMEDICSVYHFIQSDDSFIHPMNIFLFAYSMGGLSATIASHYLQSKGNLINGLILLCSLKTLDVRSPEVMTEWKEKGVYFRHNPRTNQFLPQGSEFLEETLASDSTWNMERVCKELKMPVFVAHAKDDEAVPFDHSESIFSWITSNPNQNKFLAIPNAGHTLNTAHPNKRDSEEFQYFMEHLVEWVNVI